MFLLDLAFAMELVALGVGIGFIVWSSQNTGTGIFIAKTGGYFIAAAACLSLICTSYYGLNYWAKGYFKTPTLMVMKAN